MAHKNTSAGASLRSPALWAVLAGCAYLLLLLFTRFADFPGLHGDEAWAGLFALRLLGAGFYSIHGMNPYTGALYSGILAGVFKASAVSVATLRLPGLMFNSAAALIVCAHFYRRFGSKCALFWLYLTATSGMFVFHARVAGDVQALQALLAALILVLMDGFLTRNDYSFPRVLLFLAINFIGIHNHFIFLSMPLSLLIFAFFSVSLRQDRRLLPLLRLTLTVLLMGTCLFFAQPALTEARWMTHRLWAGPLLLSTPLWFAWLFIRSRKADAPLERLAKIFAGGWPRAALIRLTGLGLLSFVIWHGAPLLQIWSNVIIFKRFGSWSPAWWISVPLHVWAGVLLAVVLSFSLRSLRKEQYAKLSPYERFLAFWPLAYAAFFILFRHTSSLRYYILISFILMAAGALALSRRIQMTRAAALIPLLGVGLLVNVIFWREMHRTEVRRPISFKVGWRQETSWAFLPKTPLHEMMRRERVCRFDQEDSFIDIPLFFYLTSHAFDCDYTKVFKPRYCLDCEDPPYFAWTIRSE